MGSHRDQVTFSSSCAPGSAARSRPPSSPEVSHGTPSPASRPPSPPRPPLPSPLPQRREQRSQRVLATRAVRNQVVSLVGVIGRPVRNPGGDEVGEIVDFVAKWDGGEPYPPVTGIVVRVGRQPAWVPGDNVADLT